MLSKISVFKELHLLSFIFLGALDKF